MKFYKCPQCSYFSANRISALAHRRRAHKGEKRKLIVYSTTEFSKVEFNCEICKHATFGSFEELTAHLRRAHKIHKLISKHFSVILKKGKGPDVTLRYTKTDSAAALPKATKPARDKAIAQAIMNNHAILRVPAMIVIDLNAGTSTIKTLNLDELLASL